MTCQPWRNVPVPPEPLSVCGPASLLTQDEPFWNTGHTKPQPCKLSNTRLEKAV